MSDALRRRCNAVRMGRARSWIVVALLAFTGCSSGDDAAAAEDEETTTSTEAPTLAEEIAQAFLGDGTALSDDQSDAEVQARCLGERLVADFSADDLERAGLPDDLDEITRLFVDEASTLRFFDAMFTCVDMRDFLIDEISTLPRPQAACVADLVLVDEQVRLLFVLGTTRGSPGPPEGAFTDELERLDTYIADCVGTP